MKLRTKLIAAGAVMLLAAAPYVIAGHEGYGTENRDVVTGHTVFVDDREFDPNIAAIAGITERKVVWFNGLTIFDTTTRGFVIAVEAGQCDPTDGVDWRFVDQDMTFQDPNGQAHVVTHYTYRCQDPPRSLLANLADGTDIEDGLLLEDNGPLDWREDAWVTTTHDKIDDPTVMDEYNFALAVFTKDFESRKDGSGPPCTSASASHCHDGDGGSNEDEIKDGDSNFNGTKHTPDPDNSTYNSPHKHFVAEVDLFFSRSDPSGFDGGVAGQSTGCADFNYNATAVNETAEGDECRRTLGCAGSGEDPPYTPNTTTGTYPAGVPPCTDEAPNANP